MRNRRVRSKVESISRAPAETDADNTPCGATYVRPAFRALALAIPASVLCWALVAVLATVQLAFTLRSRTQLRYEEIAESIRNVYWLDLGQIYDGTSSNLGYYGLLLAVYRLFGFSVYAAKWVRAILALATLLSLAWIARRTIPGRYGLVALAAAGLSPTMLYFNVLQTSYGMDLQYFPVCAALLTVHSFDRRPAALGLSLVIGFVCILAAMSFPTFLFSLPMLAAWAVGLFLGKRTRLKVPWKNGGLHLLVFLAGLAAPFLLILHGIDRPGRLLNDPITGHGIFRGGGSFLFDRRNFLQSTRTCLGDLFVRGSSYHFELPISEFGGLGGWIAFGAAAAVIGASALWGPSRRIFLALLAMLLVSVVLPSFSAGEPGIRRCTTVLIAFYAMYFLALKTLASPLPNVSPNVRLLGVVLLSMLPAHHLYASCGNWRALPERSLWNNYRAAWFRIEGDPAKSLDRLLDLTKKGEALVLKDEEGRPQWTNYAEIYAALSGYRRWNRLPQVPIMAYDHKTNSLIALDPEIWDTYYFPH